MDLWKGYRESTFAFNLEAAYKSIPKERRREIIYSFSYMQFTGQVTFKNPDVQFEVFEEHKADTDKGNAHTFTSRSFHRVYFGRFIAYGQRSLVPKFVGLGGFYEVMC